MPLKTAEPDLTTKVVLDTNLLVGVIDANDTLHFDASALVHGAQRSGRSIVFLDFLVEGALGVLVRRAKQRRTNPPNLELVVETLRHWQRKGLVVSTTKELDGVLESILDVVTESAGVLNPNDAKIVLLQRSGSIGELATLDRALASFPGLCLYQALP